MRLSTSTTFQLQSSGFPLSQHIPISSHELLSLSKTNVKKVDSGNVTGLKFENRTRTQSHLKLPIVQIMQRTVEHLAGDLAYLVCGEDTVTRKHIGVVTER